MSTPGFSGTIKVRVGETFHLQYSPFDDVDVYQVYMRSDLRNCENICSGTEIAGQFEGENFGFTVTPDILDAYQDLFTTSHTFIPGGGYYDCATAQNMFGECNGGMQLAVQVCGMCYLRLALLKRRLTEFYTDMVYTLQVHAISGHLAPPPHLKIS